MPCGDGEKQGDLAMTAMGHQEVKPLRDWALAAAALTLGLQVPERPQSEQDTSSSGCPVFLLIFESPRQKSQ